MTNIRAAPRRGRAHGKADGVSLLIFRVKLVQVLLCHAKESDILEKLVALCLLWAHGLGTKEDYCSLLDGMFLDDPNDEFLFDLENLTSDKLATLARLRDLVFLDAEFDADKFGRELFLGLEKFCGSGAVTIKEFCERCYSLWNSLPVPIDMKEPFDTLCYASDLTDDGARQREYLQYAFDYYKETI